MAISNAQLEASKRYHKKLDEIKVRVPKGERQQWQAYAAGRGESLNGFIIRAVAETMEREMAGRDERSL